MPKKEDKKTKDEQSPAPQLQHELEAQKEQIRSILHIPTSRGWSKAQCCGGVLYIVLSALVILIAAIEIIVASTGAAVVRFYEEPLSARLVAMIVLAVVGVLAIGIAIYAIIGVKTKHTKPLHTTAIVLIILAVIQALIVGVSVHVSEADEMHITRSLSEAFYRAKDGDLTQRYHWDSTQSGLECCGLYGAEDYRNPYSPANYPPDIPFSCCPSYHSPNATNGKELEMCRARKSYFKSGCKGPVLDIIRGASHVVLSVTIVLMVAELVTAVFGGILSIKRKEEKHDYIEFTPPSPKTVEVPPQQPPKKV